MNEHERSVADVVAETLTNSGISTVYGIIGEETIELVAAFDRAGIEFVTCRHEQFAALMAANEARATSRVGVCCSTLGPGALNLLTGLAHAQLGGMPVLALTGQKPATDNTEGPFQVIDIPAVAAPMTKWASSLHDPLEAAATMEHALAVAASPRPGVVLLEIPEDVLAAPAAGVGGSVSAHQSRLGADPGVLEQFRELLTSSRAPVALIGHGVSDESTATTLVAWLEANHVPALAMQMAKGAVPEHHPLSYRSLGIHRPDFSHLGLLDADLVIAIGYEPVEHPPLAWNPQEDLRIVHLAPWAPTIVRGYRPHLTVRSDIATALEQLTASGQNARRNIQDTIKRRRVINELLDDERRRLTSNGDARPNALDLVCALERTVDPATPIALDNGIYKVWFARQHRTEVVGQLLMDNALATMGAGIATAAAAARARTDGNRQAIAVCGDGGFVMNLQALQTVNDLHLPLVVIVLRNDRYGFIDWKQDDQGEENLAVAIANPDLELIARGFAFDHARVERVDQLDDAITAAVASGRPTIVECLTDDSIDAELSGDLFERALDRLENDDG